MEDSENDPVFTSGAVVAAGGFAAADPRERKGSRGRRGPRGNSAAAAAARHVAHSTRATTHGVRSD